jgi:hypothetical protein
VPENSGNYGICRDTVVKRLKIPVCRLVSLCDVAEILSASVAGLRRRHRGWYEPLVTAGVIRTYSSVHSSYTFCCESPVQLTAAGVMSWYLICMNVLLLVFSTGGSKLDSHCGYAHGQLAVRPRSARGTLTATDVTNGRSHVTRPSSGSLGSSKEHLAPESAFA